MTDFVGTLTLSTAAPSTYSLTKWLPRPPDVLFGVRRKLYSFPGITVDLEVIVSAASQDALAAAIEAFAAQVQQGSPYVHFQPGVSNPTSFIITGVTNWQEDAVNTWMGLYQRISFTVAFSALPAGALVVPYSAAAVNAPASVLLDVLLGSQPPTLDVTVLDTSGNNMHSVWAALAPSALSDAKWRIYASALTWTTMSVGGADAAMWNNDSRYTTSSSYQTASIDTSGWSYPAGKYRLLVRVRQAAGTGYVMDSQNQNPVAITRTTPHLMVIGDLDLPTSDSAPGTAAPLTISVKSDGTNRFDINAIVLLPMEYGYYSWHPATDTKELTQLDAGPSGIFMDGLFDATSLMGGPLTPDIVAANVGSLVADASPSGSAWPTTWARTNSTDVTAASSKFHIVCASASTKTATYASTNATTPLVAAGTWYEISLTRQVTAWTAGTVQVQVIWQDVDGNAVRTDVLSSVAATDATPASLTFYAKAPVRAVRAQLLLGGISATATVDFSAVVLRRCPLRLIVVAEDAFGALVSNAHPVALTVKYTPRYFVAR